jgi:polyisoprenoid-binding protein YceI
MRTWIFEPGHTAAGFRVRHMMVTWVRGHFKNIRGRIVFDPRDSAAASADVVIDANEIRTGESARDAHLKSADFLDVQNFPRILYRSSKVEQIGASHYKMAGDLTLRDVTRPVTLDVQCLGDWQTPYWDEGVDKGPVTRAGFVATARINRHHFNVSWNSLLDRGGVVVGDDVLIEIDVEAIEEKA